MVKDIINGWTNYFIGPDETTLEEAKRRASICAKCPLATKGIHTAILPDMTIKDIQGLYCSGCGCPLSPAVRSKNYKCVKGKW